MPERESPRLSKLPDLILPEWVLPGIPCTELRLRRESKAEPIRIVRVKRKEIDGACVKNRIR
ncbi:MAG: hypothetical protein RMJ84_12745 [Sandaracinaceae bacterium]|nr:hypothetical protein [Sandaracinaceae bacterium]